MVEVWSPSTGESDLQEKLPEYQRRGDPAIWYMYAREPLLRAWRRQSDGTYTETLYTGGAITPTALPGVSIDLDAIFAAPV